MVKPRTKTWEPEESVRFFNTSTQLEMMVAVWRDGFLWTFWKDPEAQWIALRPTTVRDVEQVVTQEIQDLRD